MKKKVLLAASIFLVALGIRAFGDYTATQGAGSTVFAFVCSTTKICPASVPINSSNVEIFTAAAPAQVSLANTGSNGTNLNVNIAASAVGAVTGTATSGALGSMVNCSSTTAPTGATTGNQGYINCTPTGELRGAIDAVATGGASTTGNIAANNTTAVVVKASAGTLYGVQVYGIGSAPAYLKIYNATSATCGSGTPVKRLMIPAASTAANGAGSNVAFYPGVAFSTGITYCVTTGITDADTTAPAASTFLVNLDWQ